MQNVVRNGYKINLAKTIDQRKQLNSESELSRAIHFLSSMEICDTCRPANEVSFLKLGKFNYEVDYKSRIISVSE